MKVVVNGYTLDGKLHIKPEARLVLQDGVLLWEDGPVTVVVERDEVARSNRANAYYWGAVVKELAEYTGYTPDETHEILKRQFLSKAVSIETKNGRVVGEWVIGGSTKWLTTKQFFDYVDRIRQWAFEELDVNIEPPDAEWRLRALEADRADQVGAA